MHRELENACIVWKMKVVSGARGLWSGTVEGRNRSWILGSLTRRWPRLAAQREKDQLNNRSGFRNTQKVVGGFPPPRLAPHKPLLHVRKEPRLGNFIYIHI